MVKQEHSESSPRKLSLRCATPDGRTRLVNYHTAHVKALLGAWCRSQQYVTLISPPDKNGTTYEVRKGLDRMVLVEVGAVQHDGMFEVKVWVNGRETGFGSALTLAVARAMVYEGEEGEDL